VCHHGGAGTTAAGLRAGKPTVIVPFFGDQFFWGQRVRDIGVGDTIPHKSLSAHKLSKYALFISLSFIFVDFFHAYIFYRAILQCLNDPHISKKASMMGEQIRGENGVLTAVGAFHKIFFIFCLPQRLAPS